MGKGKDRKVCGCGCGREFVPVKGWQKYLNAQHRDAYHTALNAKARELVKSGKVKLDIPVATAS